MPGLHVGTTQTLAWAVADAKLEPYELVSGQKLFADAAQMGTNERRSAVL